MGTALNYMKILEESLDKKVTILQALLEATERQGALADAETFDLDEFQNTIEQKDVLLTRLTELDQGFEQVYQEVAMELKGRKEAFRDEIQRMQQ